jgi:hypothetical protein
MADTKQTPDKPDLTIEDPLERAAEMVVECKEESLTFYKEKFQRFNYFDRLYIKGAAKVNTPIGRANLKLPLAFQQVEPFVAQMTESTLGEAPYIAFQGRTEEDEEPAEAITDFNQYQLEQGGFLAAQTSWYRNLAKYGTAVMKCVWEVDIQNVEVETDVPSPVIDPATGQMAMDPQTMQPVIEMKTVKKIEPVKMHDGPSFYNISIFDFFVPKSATSYNVQKHEWNIHRTYRSIDELINNPNYGNKKKLRQFRDGVDGDDNVEPNNGSKDNPKRIQLDQNNGKGFKKFEGKIEVLEWWGDYKKEKDEDESKPYLIVVALLEGEPVCLRCDENPFKYKFKPFLASNDYPIEGEFYGYGELDHIEGLVEESTALRNARLDVANMSLNRMWLVERQAGINLRDLYSAPNKIVLTNDLNGIKPLDMQGVTPSSVEELARIDFDIQNTTEIINPRQDVSNMGAAFGGTATGVNFMSSKSNLRMLLKTRLLEQTYFKPLAQMMLMYNRDMVDDTIWFRVTGAEENPFRQISPDAFGSEVDFKPMSNPEKLSNQERKANIEYLLQVAAQIEKVRPGTNKFEELLPEVYKLAGFKNAKKFVNPPQLTVMQTPDGQLIDQRGSPVNVMPVDQQGNPLPPPDPSAPLM